MKKIDRLLAKAADMQSNISVSLFPLDDDSFMHGLNIDLKKYEHKNMDGTIGYDAMEALNDMALDIWEDVWEVDMEVLNSDDIDHVEQIERYLDNLLVGLWRNV